MTASDHLSEMQFPYSHGNGYHQITAVHNGDSVGWLRWRGSSPSEYAAAGEISALGVNETYQRQGVATRMYQEAVQHAPVVHSRERTQAGIAWSQRVGGDALPVTRNLRDMDGPPLTPYRGH